MLALNEVKWGGSNTIQTAIGQSITMTTPIAMARYVTAIVNGGYVYDVQLIDSIISASGETIATVAFTEPNGKWDEAGVTATAWLGDVIGANARSPCSASDRVSG